jgi:phage-related protein
VSDIGLPDLRGRVILDTSSLDGAVERASRVGSAVGSAVGNFAGNLATGAVDKVVDFVSGSVDAFAQLEDATAASGVLFGSAAGQVEDFASRAGSAYGLSQRQAVEAAGTFGTFGKAAGLSGTDLAGFSTNLTGLAGDLASFKGTSTEQAIEAVGAALRGESEPIRAYGVLLDDATLRQEAMALGLTKTTNEALTPQQKVLAAQSAILKQTSDAQGDFARTSDSTANTAKRLTAESENQQAALGQRLAPAMTAVRGAIITLIDGITGLLDFLGRMASFVSDNALAFALIGGAITALVFILGGAAIAGAALNAVMTVVRVATVAWTAVQWLLNAAMAANPIGLIVIAIALLVGALILAWNNSETFRNVVLAVWAAVSGAVSTAVSTVAGWIGNLIGWLVTAWTATVDFATRAVAAVSSFAEGVGNWIDRAVGWFASLPGRAVSALASLGGLILDIARNAFNTFNNAVTSGIDAAISFLASLPGRALSALSSLVGYLAGVGRNALSELQSAVSGGASGVISYVAGIPGRILGALSSLGSLLYSAGRDLIQGLMNGIGAMASSVASKAREVVSSAIDAAKSALGLGSPSRIFHQFGLWTGEGFINGLDAQASAAADAADRLLGSFTPPDMASAVTAATPVSSAAAAASSAAPIMVRVFIGETELTDLVDVRVESGMGQLADALNRGTA